MTFALLHTLNFGGLPPADTAAAGFTHCEQINVNQGLETDAQLDATGERLRRTNVPYVFLDVEDELANAAVRRSNDQALAQRGVDRYANMLRRLKAAAPATRFALYVDHDFWGAVERRQVWRDNLRWFNDQIGPFCDWFAPQLYDFINPPLPPGSPPRSIEYTLDLWRAFAGPTLEEFARYPNPCHPLVWWVFHCQGHASVANTRIPPPRWRAMLDTVQAGADGALVWGGWDDVTGTFGPLTEADAANWQVAKEWAADVAKEQKAKAMTADQEAKLDRLIELMEATTSAAQAKALRDALAAAQARKQAAEAEIQDLARRIAALPA